VTSRKTTIARATLHDDHGQIGSELVEVVAQLDPVHRRHHQVGEDDVGKRMLRLGQSRHTVRHRRDREALRTEQARERLARLLVVVDHEDVHRARRGRGESRSGEHGFSHAARGRLRGRLTPSAPAAGA
jgi:hypothetical protein